MDFGRGLSFMRRDPNWIVKILLGSVLSMVPILNFAATGYGFEVIRNVYNGQETPLPEWGDGFGDKWVRGLIGTVVAFIYMLPALVLGCGWAALTASTSAALEAEQAANGGPAALALCLLPILFVLFLVLILLGWIAQGRYAITNSFGEAMRFGQVFADFRANLSAWLGTILMLLVLGIAAAVAIGITCGLGYLFSFYMVLAASRWVAQGLRRSEPSFEPGIAD